VTAAARRRGILVLAPFALFAILPAVAVGNDETSEDSPATYIAEIEEWRSERETGLTGDEGWLTLVGLFWLQPGVNAFGSDPELPVVLPEGAAPAQAGTLTYDGKSVWLESGSGVELTVNGEVVTEAGLHDDSEGKPDEVRLGRLLFYIIQRDGRHAVRVKDPESPARRDFQGLSWFPVDPAHRVEARFEAFDEPLAVQIPTAAGTQAPMLVPGIVVFSLDGEERSLRPLIGSPDEDEFFFILKDQTSGRETYGAGRYMYGTLEGNRIVLDFNKAYNPPCVFTKYATCPLPPRENRLKIRLLAGEKSYGGH